MSTLLSQPDETMGDSWHWLTEKIFMGGFYSLAYGGHLYLVCAVCGVTIWRDIMFSSEVCWHNRHILLHALLLFL